MGTFLGKFCANMVSMTMSQFSIKSKNRSPDLAFFLTYNRYSYFRNNKEAKVNNFYLIEDALRMLKVRFDGKMTHSIMQEERGAALRLLYQLKLAIQKREGPPADYLEAMTMTGLKASQVNRKMQ